MTAYNPEAILTRLETAIRKQPLTQPPPVSGDRWLLSSFLHKSVRWGEVERAERAAAAFWHSDRTGFWKKIIVICVEDCGVASPDVVVSVLTAAASPDWRRRVGDLRTGLYLARLLCQSLKTRIGDEILLQAERSGIHCKLREQFATASDNMLTDYITDDNRPVVERALALWYLHGTTRKLPSETMPPRKGTPDKAVEVLRSLPVPTELTESCIAVMHRTSYPLALFTMLALQTVEKQRNQLQIRENVIPVSPEMEGLPYTCADLYTRVGQTCFRQLQKIVPELQRYTVRQVGVAVFYLEGGLLDRFITSPDLEKFSIAGELADAEGHGLSMEEYVRLKYMLSLNMELLETIRAEQLHRYLNGTEPDKVNAIGHKPSITHSGIKGGALHE